LAVALNRAPYFRSKHQKAAGDISRRCPQNINAINRGDGENGIALEFQLALAVTEFHDAQLALQNFRQKFPSPQAGSRNGIQSVPFLLHQIEHGGDFPSAVSTSPWSVTRCLETTCDDIC